MNQKKGAPRESGAHKVKRSKLTSKLRAVKQPEWWAIECQLARAHLKLAREGLALAKEIQALKSRIVANGKALNPTSNLHNSGFFL